MIRLVLGVALVAAGLAAVAFGISLAVGQAGALEEDAVARGDLGAPAAAVAGRGELTVFVDFDGTVANSDARDAIVAGVECEVRAEGHRSAFSGARQGSSATLGDLASVGSFTLPGAAGRIRCVGPRPLAFIVTPHSTSEIVVSVLIAVAGVFAAVLGLLLAIGGWRGWRRSRPPGVPGPIA